MYAVMLSLYEVSLMITRFVVEMCIRDSLRPERLRTHVGELENDMPAHMPEDPPGRSRRGAPAFSWWGLMTNSW